MLVHEILRIIGRSDGTEADGRMQSLQLRVANDRRIPARVVPYDSASSSFSISPVSLNTDGDTRRKSSATLTLTFAFLRRSTTFARSFIVKLIRADVDSGGVSGANPSRGISSRSFFKSGCRCA